jgi:xylulokinase
VTARIIAATGLAVTEIVAIGGGSRSDLWCQIIADVMGLPVLRSASAEASALGAAMAAGVAARWFADFGAAATAMAGPITARFDPDPSRVSAYAACAAAYRTIYPRLAGFPAVP